MKNKNIKNANESIGMAIVLVIFILVFTGVGFSFYFSEDSKKQRSDKILFEECIENVAKDYCESLNKVYGYVNYNTFGIAGELHFLDEPYQIICEDKREIGIERYKFSDEEIKFCLEKLEVKD